MRLAVRHTGRSQETIGEVGERRFRSFGFVFVQVFTEVGEGMKDADCHSPGYCRHLRCRRSMSPLATATPLTFEAAVTRESGADGKWNMVIVEAPFSYDEVK